MALMGIETIDSTTTPNDLSDQWPLSSDPRRQGDDHIRVLRRVLQQLDQLPAYADNTAAKSGGLTDGKLYRTSAGVLMVVYT